MDRDDRSAAGRAYLRFARRGARTAIVEGHAVAPLHISPPLVGGDGSADGIRVALLASGGGLLSGERLIIEVQLECDARVALQTVGATRLLPAAVRARSDARFTLAEGSRLVYLPEPLIPCMGADYEQRTTVVLSAGATAIMGEVVTPGRIASGERFAYHRLSLGLRIYLEDRPLLIDRLVLEPRSGHLEAALGAATHLATMAVVGPLATEALAERARERIHEAGALGEAALAAEGVLVVRLLGAHAARLQALLGQIAGAAAA